MQIQENVVLASRTSIRLGGCARFFVSCTTESELREALAFAREKQLPLHVLGGGSNTIFSDAGFSGVVIAVDLRGVTFEDEGSATRVTAAAGEPWDAFVRACIERGLGGLECLSGIPGSVGGTPIQNVGAYGQEVAETIVEVHALDRATGEKKVFPHAECLFGYRTSRFKTTDCNQYVVTAVVYRLQNDAAPIARYPQVRERLATVTNMETIGRGRLALLAVRDTVLAIRREKSMVIDSADPDSVSCGSFFVNPILTKEDFVALTARVGEEMPSFSVGERVKVPAAWLIEHAGFPKGYTKDGVGISAHHTLALVNRGGTVTALLALVDTIETEVYTRYGIRMVREPIIVM